MSPSRVRRRRAVMGVALVALVGFVAGVAAWLASRPDDEPLAATRALVADDGRFGTAIDAGETLARAGGLLLEEARSCRHDRGAARACDARSSASAYAQVLAVHVLGCTTPGRLEARMAMMAYLDAVTAAGNGAALPQPSRLPRCPGLRR